MRFTPFLTVSLIRSAEIKDPFFMELIGHLADEITQRGYGIFLQKILPPMDGWLNRLIGSRRADGIVVIGPKYRAQSAR
jgi:DNA-binding LacI/PurR family transcriptional regulator